MRDLVPFCIYKNPNLPGGIIDLPTKVRIEDKDIFACKEKTGLKLAGTFYAINPSFTPIPYGTILMCQGPKGVHPLYDMFNLDEQCTRFIAWSSKVPNTIPLYIAKNGENTYSSLEPFPEDYEQVPYSPLYVIPPGKENYLFTNIDGVCHPEESGTQLIDCMLSNLSAPSILDLLRKESASKNRSSILKVVFFIILAVFCFLLLKKFFKINGIPDNRSE